MRQQGENLRLGQMLARRVFGGTEIIRKHETKAKIQLWPDMFGRHHNAFAFNEPACSKVKSFYYLCNGNWDDSWEGLPAEVNIMNCTGTGNAAKSLQWFAGRGHRQRIAGYYGGDPRQNIKMWIKAMQGVPNIDGMM